MTSAIFVRACDSFLITYLSNFYAVFDFWYIRQTGCGASMSVGQYVTSTEPHRHTRACIESEADLIKLICDVYILL